MKFVIPYLSKEPNPNKGRLMYLCPGPVEYNLSLQSKLPDEFDSYLYTLMDDMYFYLFISQETFSRAMDIIKKNVALYYDYIKVFTVQNMTPVYTLCPEGAYLYKYDFNFCVTCEDCGESFPYTELEQDEFYNDYDYQYTDTKCPKCGAWNCCEIEFQK